MEAGGGEGSTAAAIELHAQMAVIGGADMYTVAVVAVFR